ncbi:hypothetical protein PR202_ga29263 [Eleusine coracana subsp. coracana]|uniref:DUF4283 domain-containing protein n=1 Tax=Eleusine coracana subsp. coracana TaxID=191504 RepID=A0AAV5DLX4_ELECO|nr:hypothetical protein PR202_ga29263 [Eleusine coracana subsp. coracana]
MDTVNHAWQEIGNWLLPFYGKVEYVPELKLWFGLSTTGKWAAADLSTISTMDSRPRLLGKWNEFNALEEWQVVQEPQRVNLGSGRFCVARFFQTTTTTGFDYFDNEMIDREFTVFTGVEVVPRVNGNGHKKGSSCSNGNGSENCSGGDIVNGNGSGSDNGNCSGTDNGNGNHNCNGKRKMKLQMITRTSRCFVSTNGTIVESVF